MIYSKSYLAFPDEKFTEDNKYIPYRFWAQCAKCDNFLKNNWIDLMLYLINIVDILLISLNKAGLNYLCNRNIKLLSSFYWLHQQLNSTIAK